MDGIKNASVVRAGLPILRIRLSTDILEATMAVLERCCDAGKAQAIADDPVAESQARTKTNERRRQTNSREAEESQQSIWRYERD